jgi:hypothetical protein
VAAPAEEPAPATALAEPETTVVTAAVLPDVEPEAEVEPVRSDAQLETRAIDSWSAQEWDQLERRLCERILQQLQGRVDFVLEQRLRDSMAEVLQHAVSGLTTEIREGLQQTIERIVVRAVSQELAHLQTLKK